MWSDLFTRRGMRTVLRTWRRYFFGKRGQRTVHGLRMFYRLRMAVIARTAQPIATLTRLREARIWADRSVFPRIHKLLRRARHTVLIQMFIWKDDDTGREMAKVLVECADRGVRVDITKDALGDAFEFHQDFAGTKNETAGIWRRFWDHPNIHVSHPVQDDHAKVYVIDDHILLLTGMNIADEYRDTLHDYMVEMHGQRFVEQFLLERPARPDEPVALIMNRGACRQIRPTVMDLLKNAKRSVVVEQSYLSDTAVISSLIALSRRGVRVTVVVPRDNDVHRYANMQTVDRLLAEGNPAFMRVLLYPRLSHGKIILVDHDTALIGSANLMKYSLDGMGEVNALLRGRPGRALRELRYILREDIFASRPAKKAGPAGWVWSWVTYWLAWLQL